MPISDFIRNFLQNVQYLGTGVGWTPQQQAELRARDERQQVGQQAQSNWEQQFGANEAERKARMDQEAMRTYFEGLKIPGMDVQPPASGTPSFTTSGPSMGGGGGQGASPEVPNSPPQSILPTFGQMMGDLASQGQQGQTGSPLNAPGAIPSGVTSTGNRLLPTGASSGGGGVVSPAHSVIPTPFNIPGVHGLPGLQYTPPSETAPGNMEVPANIATKLGMPAGVKLPPSQYMEAIKAAAAMEKPGKEPTKEEDQQRTASQLVAKENNLTGTFKRIADLPLEHQAAAWEQVTQLNASAADKEIKAARLQADKDRNEKYKNQKASDNEVLTELKDNPQVWFNKSLTDDQRARVRAAAEQSGIRVPTAEPTQKMKDKVESADEIQRQLNIMKQIAGEIGMENFGGVLGRMTNAEGAWGTPWFTKDPRLQTLEQEFRNHSRLLTMQEVQAFGGGRTAVQLYNAVRGVTPQAIQSGPVLQGAFEATARRAQQTKDAVKAYMYGDAYKTPSQYTEGQVIKHKGKNIKITNLQPNGDFTPVSVP
jgi:hypothetical protein